jgi:hypothetical protein
MVTVATRYGRRKDSVLLESFVLPDPRRSLATDRDHWGIRREDGS